MKRLIALVLALALLAGCSAQPAPLTKPDSFLYVEQVENLPEDFILGMDVSSVLAEEASGVVYRDFDGKEQDLFRLLSENGLTHIRVRVWNDPYDENGNGFGGGNNDVEKAAEIGKRAAKYGLKLIVDFHYSDFWADPGKQQAPRAWEGLAIEDKAAALHDFTVQALQTIQKSGAEIDMVSVGNETNNGLAGETGWYAMSKLFSAGSAAVRETCPKAKVALHFANPENSSAYMDYAKQLKVYDVDYDVFATSYYPYWHGTLENLQKTLSRIAEGYDKKTFVMETSYANTPEDTDFSGNTISDESAVTKDYPYTMQGQTNCVRNVIATAAQTTNCLGVCYWEGAWITVGGSSYEENQKLWEQYGSGWASSYAAVYDPEDAGKWYGGSAVDNQCFFGPDGTALESLKVFRLVRFGNEAELKVDDVNNLFLQAEVGQPVALPETVDVIMTDNSAKAVPANWIGAEQLSGAGPGSYVLSTEVEGREVSCTVQLIAPNMLENGSFESGELGPWTVEDLGGAEQLYVEQKQSDSLSGEWHMHFWSAAKNSVEFTMEQTPSELSDGVYRFSVSIMGGDGGETEIYAYAKLDGELVATAPMEITSYGSWDTGVVDGIEYHAGQTLTVGIYVKCAGAGNGAWGKIDDAALNAVG